MAISFCTENKALYEAFCQCNALFYVIYFVCCKNTELIIAKFIIDMLYINAENYNFAKSFVFSGEIH